MMPLITTSSCRTQCPPVATRHSSLRNIRTINGITPIGLVLTFGFKLIPSCDHSIGQLHWPPSPVEPAVGSALLLSLLRVVSHSLRSSHCFQHRHIASCCMAATTCLLHMTILQWPHAVVALPQFHIVDFSQQIHTAFVADFMPTPPYSGLTSLATAASRVRIPFLPLICSIIRHAALLHGHHVPPTRAMESLPALVFDVALPSMLPHLDIAPDGITLPQDHLALILIVGPALSIGSSLTAHRRTQEHSCRRKRYLVFLLLYGNAHTHENTCTYTTAGRYI
ncbi:hypothetical protein ABZP36_022289 [Zizania latifolia]